MGIKKRAYISFRKSVIYLKTLIGLAFVLVLPFSAYAQTIDLALDLYYAAPANPSSGGSWQLVAKASNRGISAATVRLTGVEPEVIFLAPFGSGNDVAHAGFERDILGSGTGFVITKTDYLELIFAQLPNADGTNQGLFYDVGVPGGATQPGENGTPGINGFVPSHQVPWDLNDLLGDFIADCDASNNNGAFQGGVVLAAGRFSAGSTPNFFAGRASKGNVFTAVGTQTDPPSLGTIVEAAVSTQVRDNSDTLGGDINLDGHVDASDFNIWNQYKFTQNPGWLVGDLNADGLVDASDFNIWNMNKFQSAPCK